MITVLFIVVGCCNNVILHGMAMLTNVPLSPIPPPQLDELFSKGLLSRPRPNIYILGTVHLGSKSSQDVQCLMEAVEPTNVVLEISPSRLKRIQQQQQKRIIKGGETLDVLNNESQSMSTSSTEASSSKQMDFISAVLSLPAIATEGYTKGGISGFLFSTIIVWSSLVKRSITQNEEEEVLPRTNEFEKAIEIATDINALARANNTTTEATVASVTITPADIEFEELIQSVAKSMTLLKWINLGINVLSQTIGLQPSDPVRRKDNESITDWEDRRRDVNVARASRNHGETSFPEITQVLVHDRDTNFARLCLESDERGEITVCIVGLVHVDGIVDLILESNT